MGKIVGSLDFSLPRDLFSILLLQVSMWGSDSFTVLAPSEPIVALLGADTALPCRVAPAMSAEDMELRWFRSRFADAVYAYEDRVEQTEQQLVDFRGRAELVKDHIAEGRVAVRIRSVRVSDNGMYTCFFKKGNDFEEAILELKVIGLGSGPNVFMVGPEDGGIRLKCTGKRWFPQPEVQWKDVTGEKIPSLSEDKTQDDDGLFQIEASLVVRDSSWREVSCTMKNPFFGQEQVETIFIPEPFFPRTSPWKVAFAVTFLILGIFIGAVVFLTWKEQQERKRVQEAQEEKEKESQAKESLKKELDRRKELYNQDWRKAGLYADWRKEHFKAVAVTLDPDTAHTKLILSEDRTHVSSKENVSQNHDGPAQQEQEDTFSVLGQNCFTAGRHYWEAEVKVGTGGPGTRWALGVCSATVRREGWFVESPEKNFWVVAYKEGEIRVLTSQSEPLSLRQCPHKIGVFLDWEAGDVSFYNMDDGSHMYSFTRIQFCGILRPYFSLQGPGTSVAICTASDHTENCPDSSPKTSVTHSRSSDMGVPQEANSLLPP
ncbi:PREDICTED: butyrophilin subfamily 1 member A1-like [Myotis davidii]|uniref:butyrophilin subfamily 1 member A1-like n=1 Tax=Myotis davidii TaxID=225400 RepID=UPI0003EC5377|nr:PREDICTED: butyrophilin subfamily 1 member A1-like [Myotis davidii]